MEKYTIPNAEPFFLPGGKTGCLLVHGFTGAPTEMRQLGDFLHQQGHTVLGVRLAGHATKMKDMIRSRHKDWLVSVEDGWHLLQGHTERIFLIGLSMGGVLSLITASRLPVAGVVAMSTPYLFPDPLFRKIPWALRLASPIIPLKSKNEGQWFTPELTESHISYSHNPVRSVYELAMLIERLQVSLPAVQVPALVIHSKNDDYVPPDNANLIYQHLGSQNKELIWVDQANHVITRDGDTARVFKPIAEFIQTH
ncbi:MAG: alpha/beta fold hydrolase [Chloroflexota bacterium]